MKYPKPTTSRFMDDFTRFRITMSKELHLTCAATLTCLLRHYRKDARPLINGKSSNELAGKMNELRISQYTEARKS